MAFESYTANTPENTSLLQPTKYTFIIPDMPFLKYFCQTVTLPSVSTSEVGVPTPFTTTYRHGDKLVFEALVLTALVDEDLRLWEETYKWLEGLTRPKEYEQYIKSKNPKAPLYFDGYLTINTNSNNPNMRIKFLNCHPTSLSGVNFDTKVDADTIPTCDITFRYDRFEIERL